MALDTALARNAAVDGVKAKATHVALYSTAASGSAGTEVVSRLPITWSASSNGVVTGSVTFTGFSAGASAQSFGLHDALTGGNYVTGGALSPTRTGLQPSDQLTVNITLTAS